MKTLTVLLEVIFVLCIVGLTLRFFRIERAEDLTAVFYAVGAVSFVLSTIFRNSLKKREHSTGSN